MSCERVEQLRHLVVEHPEALNGEDWRIHFEECAGCQEEWEAYAQSLAIFKQLESERLALVPLSPSWKDFAATLRGKTSGPGRTGVFRVSVAAAAAGLVILAGAASWSVWGGAGVAPEVTAGSEAQTESEANRAKWVITPEQLRSMGRRMPPTFRAGWNSVAGGGTVVFEITKEISAGGTPRAGTPNQTAEIELKQFGIVGAFPAGRPGVVPRTEIAGDEAWRPPVSTPVSARSYNRRIPASFTRSR